jgi:type IV secretory pathway VirJ component
LSVDRVSGVVPPSLPTGTVSRTSTGTRTFPPESDREQPAAAASAGHPPQAGAQAPTASTHGPLRSAIVPRREHDIAVSREHERVAELEAENEALREYIETQAAERREIVERYERLLQRRDAGDESVATTAPTDDESVVETVRAGLDAVRKRVKRRLGLI